MYFQARDDLVINLDHYASIIKRAKSIQFNHSSNEVLIIDFKTNKDRDFAFDEILRLIGAIEWKS